MNEDETHLSTKKDGLQMQILLECSISAKKEEKRRLSKIPQVIALSLALFGGRYGMEKSTKEEDKKSLPKKEYRLDDVSPRCTDPDFDGDSIPPPRSCPGSARCRRHARFT